MQLIKDFIEVNPNIIFGKSCVKGTRVPVDLILEKLGSGETMEDLLDAYPKVSKDAIVACLTYASF